MAVVLRQNQFYRIDPRYRPLWRFCVNRSNRVWKTNCRYSKTKCRRNLKPLKASMLQILARWAKKLRPANATSRQGLGPNITKRFHILSSVWPDWAIYWTLATIILSKSPTFLGNFCKGIKIIYFLVKSYLGNFYWHWAIFIWSHWLS